ncbi:MAG: LTA synthase family protein [Negativicutes bacterium]
MIASYLKFIKPYKWIVVGTVSASMLMICWSFRFYIAAAVFPYSEFTIEAANILLRDFILLNALIYFHTHIHKVKQWTKDYLPVAIVAFLCIGISAAMIFLLNLNVMFLTLFAVVTGLFNNLSLLLLAACFHTRWRNRLTNLFYFFVYFVTLAILFTDTAYFFVTSEHIANVVFDNINIYSLQGVLFSTDKWVLSGIFFSFMILICLYRSPQISVGSQKVMNVTIMVILLCLATNLATAGMSSLYRKALRVIGNEGSANIEIHQRTAREMLTTPVALNLVQEYVRNDQKQWAEKWPQRAITPQDKEWLGNLGISSENLSLSSSKNNTYEKIVLIIAESLHRDFLHFYNPRIPAEATPFFDSLCAQYPRSDHFFTSARPTTPSLNAMFLSQMIYSSEQAYPNNPTIFRILEKNGFDTVFLSATSQYYNNEFRDYKKHFGMLRYRAKEDLAKQGYVGSSGWGFHNNVMYEETLRILAENRRNKLFLVTKTIDFHQPDVYCGIKDENLPQTIRDSSNQYLKGIYWENVSLQNFFLALAERKLLDDKTLIIITGDHNPHPSQGIDYKSIASENMHLKLGPLPLIFVTRNLQPFASFNSQTFASQIDLAPTIWGLLGIPAPKEFSGRNMLTLPRQQGYAVGYHDNTIFYKSSTKNLTAGVVDNDTQNHYETALMHWAQESFIKYLGSNDAK